MERYCTTAFMEESRPYWQLRMEACDLAPAETLRHGVAAGCWTLADPAATAVRLGALHDGLVALLLSGIGGIGPAEAERHLRTAFALDCGLPADRARP